MTATELGDEAVSFVKRLVICVIEVCLVTTSAHAGLSLSWAQKIRYQACLKLDSSHC